MKIAVVVALLLAAFCVAIQAASVTYNHGGSLITDLNINLDFPFHEHYFFEIYISVFNLKDGDDLHWPAGASAPSGVYGYAQNGYKYDGYDNWSPYRGGRTQYIYLYTYPNSYGSSVTLNDMIAMVESAEFTTTSTDSQQRGFWIYVYSYKYYDNYDYYYYYYYTYDTFWNNNSPTYFSPVPNAICGNGQVETGEDCDSPSPCCVQCKFATNTTVCRPAISECDEIERCTGSSDICPQDLLSPADKTCGELVGFCDVRIDNKCDGISPYCHGVPFLTMDVGLWSTQASWENFNVISLGDFTGTSGQVEGRLAVRGNANLGDWSIGAGIDTTSSGNDRHMPFSFLVGGDASWSTGSLWPDGSSQYPSQPEDAVVLGEFDAPGYLRNRTLGNNGTLPTGRTDFDNAASFYSRISQLLSSGTPNARSEAKWGGITITCDNPNSNFYYVDVDGAAMSSSTWWNLENCSIRAFWALNIRGSGNVNIQGGDFPGIVERTIYNVIGSRSISAPSGLRGNLLATDASLSQAGQVTGLIIAGDVTSFKHARNPNCIKFDPVTITKKLSAAYTPSGKRATTYRIEVYSVSGLEVGDVITFPGGETAIILGATQIGAKYFLDLDHALTGSYDVNASFTVSVSNPDTVVRTPINIQKQDPSSTSSSSDDTNYDYDSDRSSASQLVAMYLAALIAMLSLFF